MTVVGHWTAVPLTAALVLGGAVYVRAWRTTVATSRAVLFTLGVLVLVVALIGPLDRLGEQRLLSAHMVQHILLMSIAPALLLSGAAGVLYPRKGEPLNTRSWLCAVGGVAAIWLLHVPPVLDAGLRVPALNDAQHLLLLASGLAMTWPLLGSARIHGFAAAAYLVGCELALGVLGIWLAWYPDLIYSGYAEAPRTWGLSAETDQALAGAILLVVEEPLLAVEFAIIFIAALSESERIQVELEAGLDSAERPRPDISDRARSSAVSRRA